MSRKVKPEQEQPSCPHCIHGKGKYQKGWDIKQKHQKKGGKHGEMQESGQIIRISLYKCQRCRKLFRKGRAQSGKHSN